MLRIKTKLGHIMKYAEYTKKMIEHRKQFCTQKMDNLDKYTRSHSV